MMRREYAESLLGRKISGYNPDLPIRKSGSTMWSSRYVCVPLVGQELRKRGYKVVIRKEWTFE